MTSLEELRINRYKYISNLLRSEISEVKWYASKDFYLSEFRGEWDSSYISPGLRNISLTEEISEVVKQTKYLLALTWKAPFYYPTGITLCHPVSDKDSEQSLKARFDEISRYTWLNYQDLMSMRLFKLDEYQDIYLVVPHNIREIFYKLDEMKDSLEIVEDISKIHSLQEKHLSIFVNQIIEDFLWRLRGGVFSFCYGSHPSNLYSDYNRLLGGQF